MKKIFLTIIIACIISCQSNKEVEDRLVLSNFSDSAASNWRDALISGNGEMGIMVYGNPSEEKIIFNHELLYEYIGTETIEPPFVGDIMPEVKQLIKNSQYQEAKTKILELAKTRGYQDILWTDPYHPACVLNFNQDFKGAVLDYQRLLNYENGEVTVNWLADNVDYTRTSFVSRPDKVIATKIISSKASTINVSFDLTHQFDTEQSAQAKESGIEQNVKMLFPDRLDELNNPLVEKPEISLDKNWITFRSKYQLVDRGYEVIVKIKNVGGTLTNAKGIISVENADSVEVLAKVIPIEPYSKSELLDAKAAIENLPSYDVLLSRHSNVHGEMFNRVSLHLDKTGFLDGSNETLIASQKTDEEINPYLLEKVFNMGIYGLISSSGENPPNLMGIWNGSWRPRWSGDFTLDANINLQIAAANLANQKEAIDSYMTLLERIAPDWEVNAKHLFGCRGYVSGTRTSGRRNFHTHFGQWPGNYWTAGVEWLLLPCYEYYQCTGDKEFMLNRLYPMMKKTALFYEDFLDTYDDDGTYLIGPSYSPENKAILPNGDRLGAVANATMDIAVIRELLTNLITLNKELDLRDEKVGLWKNILEKLPSYLINEDGALKEWARKDLGENYNHRHISHLYPVWPGLEISPENKALFDASNVAIEKRGRGNGSAHGLAHTALIATRLKKADLVYGNLLFLMKNDYLYNSLVTSHNPGIIYNTDALHSIPAVILEMLVFSKPGVIEFLPALSEKLQKGSVSGVLCRTQAKLEHLEWDMTGKTMMAKVSSGKKQDIKFQLRKPILEVKVNGEVVNVDGDTFKVTFNVAEVKDIIIKWK
ncbi:glycosyl hydrolase family 95 catalytic domain-containing protein [Seonamhaeicola marinus]|uniref:Glycoside hydrolase family 95 protein n=1 Tax=Seonamhaeicola marinus TaxID=1912246 RepID=A0A5D0HUT0_9FLAO|nr:glycoside hydrolase N-terminal domain-containing protein [Seonamhaeicola marinus]TYA74671.1 glycoside hydrolase family 95 protein [Seonamhaeicola marinus]